MLLSWQSTKDRPHKRHSKLLAGHSKLTSFLRSGDTTGFDGAITYWRKSFDYASILLPHGVTVVPANGGDDGHKSAEVDLRTVQQWLGHSDMESTMRYLKPSRSQQVREKVNEIFA